MQRSSFRLHCMSQDGGVTLVTVVYMSCDYHHSGATFYPKFTRGAKITSVATGFRTQVNRNASTVCKHTRHTTNSVEY